MGAVVDGAIPPLNKSRCVAEATDVLNLQEPHVRNLREANAKAPLLKGFTKTLRKSVRNGIIDPFAGSSAFYDACARWSTNGLVVINPPCQQKKHWAGMIKQLRDKTWQAECDRCGRAIATGQKSFQQAVNYISRAEGWENRKVRGSWRNYCPRCGEEANPDLDLAGIGFTKKIADEE